MPTYGPGTLQFGEVGSEIDASCLVNSCTIEPSKEAGDSKTMLCGTVKKGAVTYTYTLTGNLDVDSDDPEGLFALCDANAGQEVPFSYVPSAEGGTEATGTVVLDPLAFGGEEYGEYMASDFEFDLVGKPEYSYPDAPVPPMLATRRVVNGTPPAGVKPNQDGTYTPSSEDKGKEPKSSKATNSSSSSTAGEKASA